MSTRVTTIADVEFNDWAGQSTQTQDDARARLFAVISSYIANTGETAWLLNFIQQVDPAGTAAFVAENCAAAPEGGGGSERRL